MKKSVFALAIAMAALALPAQAQFSGAGGSKSAADVPESYNRISIGYNADFFGGNGSTLYNEDGDKGATFNGLSVQYVHGWNITDRPLYIEAGLNVTMGFHNVLAYENFDGDGGDLKYKYTKMSVAVPVNVAYRIACGDGISVVPYTGINFKVNVLGNLKMSYDGKYDDAWDIVVDELYDGDDSFSLFDKDYIGKDAQWKRFQMGWQIGCGLNYKAFYVGLEYGIDFISLAKKLNTSHLGINLGYNF